MMKSFQNKSNGFRSLQSKKCVHGRCSLKYLQDGCKKTATEHNFRQIKQCSESSLPKAKPEDPHSMMMRSLIAMNEDYFQDKLQVANDGRPGKLKLKIPSRTGFTVYKKDYIKNHKSQLNLQANAGGFKENKIKADFFGSTTYRNEYKGDQNQQPIQKRKSQQHVGLDAPTFNQSQYKHNYLNWGASSNMPSMKPHPTPAVTNLPFNPSTVYSSEFTTKPNNRKQNFKPNNSGGLSNSSSITSNCITSPLLYLTTNNVYFDKKNNSKQSNLKPKTHTLAIDGNAFRGKTEYQSEFIKSKASGKFQVEEKKPLAELQNLMMGM